VSPRSALSSLPVAVAVALGVAVAEAAPLDPELVRVAIAAEARRSLPDTVVEVAVDDLFLRGSVDVAADPFLRVRADASEDWVGTVAVDVVVPVAGGESRSIRATCTVTPYVEMPVLRRAVAHGTAISAADLATSRRPADSLPAGVLLDASSIVGRVPSRDLSLNQLVREADLEDRVDARRGDSVTLVLRRGALRVSGSGTLRNDARIGDSVLVLAAAGREPLPGVLVSPDTVELR
jgi:flagella basal body P-ring formation protein FlgA